VSAAARPRLPLTALFFDIIRKMKIVLSFCALALSLPLWAGKQPYDRYQSIVDRQMFGTPPPGFDPTKPPSEVTRASGAASGDAEQLTKEQQQLKSAIHFSVINVTPGGETAVGFTDNGDAKNPVHYYLKVGETRNGWTVKEADPIKATMTISKGEIEVSLAIGDNSAKGGKPSDKSAVAGATPAAAPRAGLLRAAPPARAGGSDLLSSLRGRRMLRERQRQDAAAQAAKREAEANRLQAERDRQAAEEKAQHEQERAEQRAQLMQIQEELRKAREERHARAREEKNKGDAEAEK
jgi:hypothetical protein